MIGSNKKMLLSGDNSIIEYESHEEIYKLSNKDQICHIISIIEKFLKPLFDGELKTQAAREFFDVLDSLMDLSTRVGHRLGGLA